MPCRPSTETDTKAHVTETPEPAATLRAFIALAPPDDAKDELALALRPVYATHPRLRQNRIEDWHITLAFLGEQSLTTVQQLRQPLAGLAAGHPSPSWRCGAVATSTRASCGAAWRVTWTVCICCPKRSGNRSGPAGSTSRSVHCAPT